MSESETPRHFPNCASNWDAAGEGACNCTLGMDRANARIKRAQLERRQELACRQDRTPDDQRELDRLDKWASGLPTASTPEDQQALDIIRRAAALLDDTKLDALLADYTLKFSKAKADIAAFHKLHGENLSLEDRLFVNGLGVSAWNAAMEVADYLIAQRSGKS